MPSPSEYPNAYGTVALTIGSAGSFSGSVFLNGGAILQVLLPGTWTAAPLSFQVTADAVPPDAGGAWLNAYNVDGEISIAASSLTGTVAYAMDPALFPRAQWVRVRSGLADGGTVQTANRTLILGVGPI